MPGTIDRVRRSILRDSLIPPGARVLAAVSGGSDSVGLLVALADLAGALDFRLAGLAHLNHGLRGADSDGDEHFCRALAARLGMPCDVGHADVGALARSGRVSMEVAARQARYRFFDEAAGRLGADLVATGHTRDDQAETLLLHLFRGAGRRGLGGIPPRRGRFVRPLLDVGRDELRAFLTERGHVYREDASNADRTILRNWIRHELIPSLDAHLGGDLTATLGRQSRLLRDEDALLDALAEDALAGVVGSPEGDQGRAALRSEPLRQLPTALARRVLRLAGRRLVPPCELGADHVEAALDVATAVAGPTAVDLPGLRVERNGETVVLHTGAFDRDRAAPPFRYAVEVPGRLHAAAEGFVLEARLVPLDRQVFENELVTADSNTAIVDAARAAGGVWVRSWHPGDALAPLGLGGRKKLQDVFVDRKTPRAVRDRVPIVVDGDDAILWVGGHVLSEHAKVTDATQNVVVFRLSRLGDLA